MNWLNRLERRFPHFGLPGLMLYVVAGRGLAWMLAQRNPEMLGYLVLDPERVRAGEVWRLVTFILMPPPMGLIAALFDLYVLFWTSRNLEAIWGTFRFTLFVLLGTAATGVASLVVTGQLASTYALDLTIFLAFATVAPEYTVLFWMVIPIKMKWVGFIDAAFLGYSLFTAGPLERIALGVSFSSYLLFCGPLLLEALSSGARPPAAPRPVGTPPPAVPVVPVHRCTVCGATEKTRPDLEFRWCSCERCGDGREFCREHLTEHQAATGRA